MENQCYLPEIESNADFKKTSKVHVKIIKLSNVDRYLIIYHLGSQLLPQPKS